MALPFPSDTRLPAGDLEIKPYGEKNYRAYFTPPAEALLHTDYKREDIKLPVFDIDLDENSLFLYPFQVGGVRTMQSRYFILSTIIMELSELEVASFQTDHAESFLYSVLPEAFIEDINYGIGFKKGYRAIISYLENFGVEKMHIRLNGELSLDFENKKANISRSDLNKMTKGINSINTRTQRVALKLKKDLVGNIFFELLDRKNTDTITKGLSVAGISKLLQQEFIRKNTADKETRISAVKIVNTQTRQIARENPEALVKLRQDIELVTLEELINRFDEMMGKKLSENHWQKLLNQNPFILNMAFGVPVIKVEEQASVGGLKFSGAGGKIADFLLQNSVSGNAAVVEIKTPGLKLLSATEYRSGMFAPSSEIAGAVNQMLDQIYMLQTNFNNLKLVSRNFTIESFSITGILIAGRSYSHPDEHKSFELFRGNSKNVQIITFDELLGKLKELHKFLSPGLDKDKLFGKPLNDKESDLPF